MPLLTGYVTPGPLGPGGSGAFKGLSTPGSLQPQAITPTVLTGSISLTGSFSSTSSAPAFITSSASLTALFSSTVSAPASVTSLTSLSSSFASNVLAPASITSSASLTGSFSSILVRPTIQASSISLTGSFASSIYQALPNRWVYATERPTFVSSEVPSKVFSVQEIQSRSGVDPALTVEGGY